MTCFVCQREIIEHTEPYARTAYFLPTEKQLKHVIDPVNVGRDTYRHRRCEPGSAKWLAVQGALPRHLRSRHYDLFLLGKVHHDQP